MVEPIILPEKVFSGFRSESKARIYEFYKYLQSAQKTKYWRFNITIDELKQFLDYSDDTDKLLCDLRTVAKKVIKTDGYFVVKLYRKKKSVMFISYK